jgi:hypothetical protein
MVLAEAVEEGVDLVGFRSSSPKLEPSTVRRTREGCFYEVKGISMSCL